MRVLVAFFLLFAVGVAAAQNSPQDLKQSPQLPAVQKPKATLPAVQLPAVQPPPDTGKANGDGSTSQPLGVSPSKNTNVLSPGSPTVPTPAPAQPMTPGMTGQPGLPPTTPRMNLPKPGLPPGSLPTQSGPGGTPLPLNRAPAPPAEVTGPTAMMERSFPAGTRFMTDRGTWICDGNRCVVRGLDLRDFFHACPYLSRPAGPVVSFRSRELSLNERELALCNSPVVQELHVTACSGADDFRIGSSLKLSWDAGGGFFPATGQPLSFINRRIGSNDCNYARILRYGIRPFPIIALRKLRFMFEGGRRTLTDQPDDWDMKSIWVQATVIAPGDPLTSRTMTVIRLQRDPLLHRFEDVSQWDIDVPPR